ncbi:MAG: TonB-dependent receptor domain-containing protein [Acidimicrobiia bacterium]
MSAAYRHERYSDAGTSRVPKYGLRWRPLGDEITLRGTHSNAFVAPSLFALFGPTTQSAAGSRVVRTGANPALKPSTAKTYSFGAVYSPKAVAGLTFGVDYVDVRQVSLVGTAGVTEILNSVNNSGTSSPYIAQVAFGNWPTNPDPTLPPATPITGPHQLDALLAGGATASTVYVTDSRINISGKTVKSLDVSASYAFPRSGLGKFGLSTTGTFFLHYRFKALPTQIYYEYAGHVTDSQGTLPGMKWFTALTWGKGNWSAALNNSYIDRVVDLGSGGVTYATSTTLRRVPVPSYSSWDTSVSYSFRDLGNSRAARLLSGLRLTLGVNNVGDKMPPAAPQAFGSDVGVDLATYNPVGRLWYLSASLKF